MNLDTFIYLCLSKNYHLKESFRIFWCFTILTENLLWSEHHSKYLCELTCLIFIISLWSRTIIPIFRGENLSSEKLSNLPMVTQPVSGRARAWTQAVCLKFLLSVPYDFVSPTFSHTSCRVSQRWLPSQRRQGRPSALASRLGAWRLDPEPESLTFHIFTLSKHNCPTKT